MQPAGFCQCHPCVVLPAETLLCKPNAEKQCKTFLLFLFDNCLLIKIKYHEIIGTSKAAHDVREFFQLIPCRLIPEHDIQDQQGLW